MHPLIAMQRAAAHRATIPSANSLPLPTSPTLYPSVHYGGVDNFPLGSGSGSPSTSQAWSSARTPSPKNSTVPPFLASYQPTTTMTSQNLSPSSSPVLSKSPRRPRIQTTIDWSYVDPPPASWNAPASTPSLSPPSTASSTTSSLESIPKTAVSPQFGFHPGSEFPHEKPVVSSSNDHQALQLNLRTSPEPFAFYYLDCDLPLSSVPESPMDLSFSFHGLRHQHDSQLDVKATSNTYTDGMPELLFSGTEDLSTSFPGDLVFGEHDILGEPLADLASWQTQGINPQETVVLPAHASQFTTPTQSNVIDVAVLSSLGLAGSAGQAGLGTGLRHDLPHNSGPNSNPPPHVDQQYLALRQITPLPHPLDGLKNLPYVSFQPTEGNALPTDASGTIDPRSISLTPWTAFQSSAYATTQSSLRSQNDKVALKEATPVFAADPLQLPTNRTGGMDFDVIMEFGVNNTIIPNQTLATQAMELGVYLAFFFFFFRLRLESSLVRLSHPFFFLGLKLTFLGASILGDASQTLSLTQGLTQSSAYQSMGYDAAFPALVHSDGNRSTHEITSFEGSTSCKHWCFFPSPLLPFHPLGATSPLALMVWITVA